MQLPILPRQNNKKEAGFGLVFRKWWEKNPLQGEIELKDTRGDPNFAFSEISREQEVICRLAISKRGVLVRRSSGTVGGSDYSGLVSSPYWVAIRYPKFFVIISLETLLLERDRSKKKSLSANRAKAISIITVP